MEKIVCERHQLPAESYCFEESCMKILCKECLMEHKEHHTVVLGKILESWDEISNAEKQRIDNAEKKIIEEKNQLEVMITDIEGNCKGFKQSLEMIDTQLESVYSLMKNAIYKERKEMDARKQAIKEKITGFSLKIEEYIHIMGTHREALEKAKDSLPEWLSSTRTFQLKDFSKEFEEARVDIMKTENKWKGIGYWGNLLRQLENLASGKEQNFEKGSKISETFKQLIGKQEEMRKRASEQLAQTEGLIKKTKDTLAVCEAKKTDLLAFTDRRRHLLNIIRDPGQGSNYVDVPHLHYFSNEGTLLNMLNILEMKLEKIPIPGRIPTKYFDSIEVKGRIYLTGGYCNKKFVASSYLLDGKELFTLPDMAYPKGFHTMCCVNPLFIYCVGGFVYPPEKWLKICEKYCQLENEWKIVPSLSEPKDNVTLCGSRGRYIYCFGGWKGHYLNTIEILDSNKESSGWQKVKLKTSCWSARHSMCAFETMPDRIIVFGGHPAHKDSYIFLSQNNSIKQLVCSLHREATFMQRKPVLYKGKLYVVDNNAKKEPEALHIYSVDDIQWNIHDLSKL